MEKPIKVENAVRVNRPILGDSIPLSLWRLLRLVAMPKALKEDSAEVDRRLGLAMGGLLAVKEPQDIITAINDAQIGICNPLEEQDGFFAVEFTECFTCSGLDHTEIARPICGFEVAIVEGAFQKMGYEVIEAKETKCMGGLGDEVCRVELRVKPE